MLNRFRNLLPAFALTTPVAVAMIVPAAATAQDDVIRPGHPAINPATIRPFHAEYEQMGTPFWLDLRRTEGERPTFSAVMTMHSFQGGIAVDHAGFFADNLAFAYRKTTFGRWGLEALDVGDHEGEIVMARMSLDPEGYPERRLTRDRPEAPMFEGTMMYWLLAALPLASAENNLDVATLAWTETGFEEAITSFRVVGREVVEAGGQSFDCIVVSTSNERFELRSFVAHRPPYLVRQVAIQDGEEQPVIALRRVEVPAE